MLKWILGFLAFVGVAFVTLPSENAQAQFNGGSGSDPFTAPGLFSVNGSVVTFSDTSFQFGDASNKISAIFVNNLNAATATISGVVPGNLTVTGTVIVTGTGTSTFAGPVSSTQFLVTTAGAAGGYFNQNSGINSAFYNVVGTGPYIGSVTNHALTFFASNSGRWKIQASNYHFVPTSDNLYQLGTTAARVSQGHFVQVSSTNVTTTRLYTNAANDEAGITMITGSNIQLQNDAARGILTSDNSLGTCMYYNTVLAGGVCASGTTVVLSAGSAAIIDVTANGIGPRTGYTSLDVGTNTDRFRTGHFVNVSSTTATSSNFVSSFPSADGSNGFLFLMPSDRFGMWARNTAELNIGFPSANFRSIAFQNGATIVAQIKGASAALQNFSPNSDGVMELGQPAERWENVHTVGVSSTNVTTTRLYTGADGTNASGIIIGNTSVGAIFCNSGGLCNINTAGSVAMQIGSASALFSRNASPATNNTYDLGANTLNWLNGFITNVSSTRGLFMEYVTSSRIALAAGSLSEPSLNFGNSATPDNNTGIYQSSANSLDFVANGSRFMKIAAGGVSVGADATPLLPLADGTVDFGDTSTWWDKSYIRQMNASTTAGGVGDALSVSGTTKMVGQLRSEMFSGTEISFTGSGNANITGAGSIFLSTSLAGGAVNIGGSTDGTHLVVKSTGTTSTVPFQVRAGSGTSTLMVGESGLPGCIGIGDNDGAGITWLTVANGAGTFSTTDCRN